MECFSFEKKRKKNDCLIFPVLSPGTRFYGASAGLSEMLMFSIFICFLKVYSHNEM
jgi:hypothetical protein